MKRKLALFMVFVIALSSVPAFPALAATPKDVVTENATIGGAGARLVYIAMSGGRSADVALANGSVHSAAGADALINRVTQDGNSSIVAAVNGGFFNAYYDSTAALSFPDNCPRIWSTVMRDGELVNGMGEANMLGVTWDRKLYIDRVRYQTWVKINATIDIDMWAVNSLNEDPGSILLFTPEFTLPVQTKAGGKVLTIRDEKVAAIADGGGSFMVPKDAYLMVYNRKAADNAQKWNSFPLVGDAAVIHTEARSCRRANDLGQWNNMKTVVAGGRMLIQNKYNVVQDAEYNAEFDKDPKQSPGYSSARTFAAVMNDGRLVLGYASASMSQIADYLQSKGAVNAISLDGGASAMLYANGAGYLAIPGRQLASAFVIVDEKKHEARPETPDAEAKPTSATGFSPNTPSVWAQEAVTRGIEHGLVPEWMQGGYRDNLTREEFCVLIVRLLEKKSGEKIDALRAEKGVEYIKNPFEDTDSWFVNECASFGVIDGVGDGRFDPKGSLTRQQAAVILMGAARILGRAPQDQTSQDEAPKDGGRVFSDAGRIASWAAEAVAFVSAKGIMKGNGDKFDPLGTYTREQAFVTIVNAYDQL